MAITDSIEARRARAERAGKRLLERFTRQFLICQQCGYEWFTKANSGRPRRCPNHDCRSTIWDRPKQAQQHTGGAN